MLFLLVERKYVIEKIDVIRKVGLAKQKEERESVHSRGTIRYGSSKERQHVIFLELQEDPCGLSAEKQEHGMR